MRAFVIVMVQVPTRYAAPYGIVVNSKGVPFFCEFGAARLASIDPETMAITEYPLPNERSRPRRVAISPDDAIWYGDYSRGQLGRFDGGAVQAGGLAIVDVVTRDPDLEDVFLNLTAAA